MGENVFVCERERREGREKKNDDSTGPHYNTLFIPLSPTHTALHSRARTHAEAGRGMRRSVPYVHLYVCMCAVCVCVFHPSSHCRQVEWRAPRIDICESTFRVCVRICVQCVPLSNEEAHTYAALKYSRLGKGRKRKKNALIHTHTCTTHTQIATSADENAWMCSSAKTMHTYAHTHKHSIRAVRYRTCIYFVCVFVSVSLC